MAKVGLVYQEARNAAEDIRTYTEAVRKAADELQDTAQAAQQKGIRVEWCELLLQKLNKYREDDIEVGLNEMMAQANKILDIEDTVKAYETEEA